MDDNNSPFHDFSRLDDWLRAKREAEAMKQRAVLNLSRGEMARGFARPLLLGACGAAAVVAAVYVTLPRFEVREVVVDHVTPHDVQVDHVVPHDVEIDHVVPHDVTIEIPHFAPAPPAPPTATAPDAPRTPVERGFERSPEWRRAIVRGRIVREAPPNGFVLATGAGEVPFYPAKLGPGGKPQFDSAMRDDMTGLLGLLGLCRKTSAGLYACFAVKRDGTEVVIPEKPAPQGELL